MSVEATAADSEGPFLKIIKTVGIWIRGIALLVFLGVYVLIRKLFSMH